MYDVITVGGGPSGAYTAYLLAREGLKVLLLDKGQPGGKLCTGIISEETFQALSLNRGCILRDIDSIEFVAPSGESFTYKHPTPFAHVVDRTTFDTTLVNMAQGAGATVHGGSLVSALEVTKDRAIVRYGSNNQFEAVARALVLATGLNRRLMHMVGLKPPDSINAVQLEIADFHGDDQVKVFLGNKIAPGSFAWLVPVGNGTARVGMSTRKRIMPHFSRFLRLIGIRDRTTGIRLRPIPYGTAAKTYANRTLVVGDAAGHAKTTTGGGIYYGLIGASMAAQTLKEALFRDNLSEENLKPYEERWKKRLGPEIETGLKLKGIFSNFSDERINSLINLARNDGVATLIRLQGTFDWQRTLFMSLLRKLGILGKI